MVSDSMPPERGQKPARNKLIWLWMSWCAICVGVYACTPTTRDAASEVQLSDDEKKKLDEFRAEVEIGRDMAGRLLAHYGSVDSGDLIGYVNQVGSYVASYSDYPDRRYMFAILRSESVNAFACPGGYVLVTLGALRNIESEAELAGILGHEVAHVGLKHMYNTLKAMDEKEMDEKAKKGKAEMDDILRSRSRPKPDETGAGAMLARYLAGTGGASINILQAAKAGMGVILNSGLDKKLEYEADREGVRYAIRAGYEPKALKQFLRRLEKGKAAEKSKNLGKTHPKVGDRVKAINKVIRALQAGEIKGAQGLKRWKKAEQDLPKEES